MDNKQPTQEELLKVWQENWEKEDAAVDYPNERKEFTLSRSELKLLIQQATVRAMAMKTADFASAAANDLLNDYVLPRVGVAPSPDVKILYDINSGRFMVWQRKDTEVKDTPKKKQEPRSTNPQ